MTQQAPQRQRMRGALARFVHDETVAGVLLLAVTIAALVWANSAAGDSYSDWWNHHLTIGTGSWGISQSLVHWVNDGLMTVFFFVVGLEIKRELVTGELRAARTALPPVIAAISGVAVPAVLFLAIAPGGEVARGFGIPMATDIAFAIGVLALLGRGAGSGAKLFLLSIAIVDDIIAIAIIAIFYAGDISWPWVGVALAGLAVVLLLRRSVATAWAYLFPGLVLWLGLLESGIHATIAGVLLGLLTPARPVQGRPVLEELERLLHPVSVFIIVPIFALANAGVDLRGGALGAALGQRLTWAVAVGLVVGKTIGIAGATFLMLRVGAGALPMNMPRRDVWPIAAIAGIGFTVALFISDLAYAQPALVSEAKIGIFIGSIAAALLGGILLRAMAREH